MLSVKAYNLYVCDLDILFHQISGCSTYNLYVCDLDIYFTR